MDNLNKQNKRLLSIDALRGFDMLMIIFADHFFENLHSASQTNFSGFLATQFKHPKWFGFHFYDIIMPLFLFLVGVVIPFSLEKRKKEIDNKLKLYPHIIKRFFILFILGWVVQGNLLHFSINEFKIFSNTLQAIAVGYLFACIFYIHLSKINRYIAFATCIIIYILLLELAPVPGIGISELLPDKNIAIYVDNIVFGRFDDGYQYTWLLSSLGFTATTLSGLFIGEILKSNLSPKKTALHIFLLGLAFITIGLFLNIFHPSVKKLWNSTFVLLSSGLCMLLYNIFYLVIDVKGIVKWSLPLKIIGVNAITAYVLSHVLNFPKISEDILFGLEQFFGAYYNALTSFGGFCIMYLLLWYMYKNKTYIKI
ncbi:MULTISPECIES: acyltransferase family protein [unclassified Cellulophaga]|uniref:acyltransferase family protein n=1 Tax=unclassified Cellulophaga TaxID=2634405 RepID=UPI0026E40B14|nr:MULTISPECIES: DUF5009 domain-containing protein [unclassified Cellulophaga]MDO6492243.1 DUF5009 domain-containing protein [Cellulophaga sp. 2_MG-2023]MDO6493193.1 DUF5009 domain-containing protein [Cellulophaga sp. 3_MG-2023]